MIDMRQLELGFNAVLERWPKARPRVALTLGSGWSAVVDGLDVIDAIDYADIPGLGATGVAGHAGRLVRCAAPAGELLVFQGRRHLYEGVGWTPIAMPVYIAKRFDVEICLLTNAAGGMDSSMRAGDLMVIEDHINMLGCNPLAGLHLPFWGERFPDQSNLYDSALRELLCETGRQAGMRMHTGTYLATLGPTFETPAEVRAFKGLGAAAVGMSTVPEAILANASGLRVAGLSFISNLAAGISSAPLSHAEVTQTAELAMPALCRLFELLLSGETL